MTEIFRKFLAGILAVVVAGMLLIAVQSYFHASSGKFLIEWFRGLGGFCRWVSSNQDSVYGLKDIFRHFPTTLILSVGAMFLASAIAGVMVIARFRFPANFRLMKFIGVLKFFSSIPAIISLILFIRIYQVEFNMGLITGPSSHFPQSGLLVLGLIGLGLGNGMVFDFFDELFSDSVEISKQDYLLAAKARNENLVPLYIRGLIVPFSAKVINKFPLFIGGTLPVEKLLRLSGVADLTWRIVVHWKEDPLQGSLYPLVAIVILLGGVFLVFGLFGDGLHYYLDPRMRNK